MEKQYINYYPFSISFEEKTSQAGKKYKSIGICHKSKDKDGNKKETYINIIDEKELLVLASACENMYHRIIKAKNDEFLANKSAEPEQPEQDPFDDEIPPL